MPLIKTIVIALVFFQFSNCARPPATTEEFSSSSAGPVAPSDGLNIDNGTWTTAYNSVGLMVTIGNKKMSYCSGTWVCPNLFLTAKHCLKPNSSYFISSSPSIDNLKYRTVSDLAPYFSQAITLNSSKITQSGQDIQLMEITKGPTQGSSFASFSMDQKGLDALLAIKNPSEKVCTAVGFGADRESPIPANLTVRQFGTVYPVSYETFVDDGVELKVNSYDNGNFAKGIGANQMINSGDSGGPLYLGSSSVILGVAESILSNSGYYTPVAPYLDVILNEKSINCWPQAKTESAMTCKATKSGDFVNVSFSDATGVLQPRTYLLYVQDKLDLTSIYQGTGVRANLTTGETSGVASLKGNGKNIVIVTRSIDKIDDQRDWTTCNVVDAAPQGPPSVLPAPMPAPMPAPALMPVPMPVPVPAPATDPASNSCQSGSTRCATNQNLPGAIEYCNKGTWQVVTACASGDMCNPSTVMCQPAN